MQKKLTRAEVYKLIDGERAYQEKVERDPKRTLQVPGAGGRDHSVGDFLTLLRVYVARADDAWADNPGDEAALDVVRKIAGIAVNCMERHGAPARNSEGLK